MARAPTAIEGILSGPQYDYVPQFLPKLIVPVIRTVPSIAWMFPRVADDSKNIWGSTDFVVTPTRGYNVTNLGDLITATNSSVIAAVWNDMQAFTNVATKDASVKTLCLHANDTKTDVAIQMPDDHFDKKGRTTNQTMGDGTVPIASLEHCSSWSKSTTHAIKFGGSLAAHTSILSNEEAIDTIIAWLESAE